MINGASLILQYYWSQLHVLLIGTSIAAFFVYQKFKVQIARGAGIKVAAFEIAAIGLIAGQVALYAAIPLYRDYAEPLMAVMALNWLNGGELYQSFTQGQGIVSSLYGPNIFLLNAAAIYVGGVAAAGKWLACTSALLSIGIVFATARRQALGDSALAITALSVALLSQFAWQWFWNRPEPFLLLVTALGGLILTSRPTAATALAVGILAGMAANQKLHAPLYLVPIGLTMLYCAERTRPSVFLCGLGGAVVTFALPFMLPGISILAYAETLAIASKHGLRIDIFVDSALTGLAMLTPALLLAASARRKMPRETLVLLATLAVTMLAVAGASAKPGSGPTHIIPFVPIVAYATGQTWLAVRDNVGTGALAAMSLAAFTATTPIAAYTFYTFVGENHGWAVDSARNRELTDYASRYARLEMASVIGDEARAVNNRFQIGLTGRIVEYDEVIWGDMRLAGVEAEAVEVLFRDCRVANWVFPTGSKPFAGSIFVDDLYNDFVRTAFRDAYAPVERGHYYEVWGCVPTAERAASLGPRNRRQH